METIKVRGANKRKTTEVTVNLNEVIDFLQKHPEIEKFENNPYSVDKLMMLLDNEKLAALEEEFNEHPSGIQLANFVLLMKSAIAHPEEDKYRLICGLNKLFDDIDINGDGHMEWSEFTQYIIDAVIGEKEAKFFDARFEKDRELTEEEIIEKAYSRKTKRYVMSKLLDTTLHNNLIMKLIYCSFNDTILCLEQASRRIKIYNPQDCSLKKESIEPQFDEKAFIEDCCYAEFQNMIGAVTSDKKIYVWENSPTRRELYNKKHDVRQVGIWYLNNHRVFITAGKDFILRSFVIGASSDRLVNPRYGEAELKSHTDRITEVLEIREPKLVATCSLDGTIKLWDLIDRVILTELRDNSTKKGVRGMTYSYEYGGNLLSFGFETHINVWCPEASLTRSYIGKLDGHSCTVVCCKFIPGAPNCVSVDEKSNIRIWDIRTMATIQMIPSEYQNLMVNYLEILPKYDKFMLGGKRMFFYDNSAVSKTMKVFNEDIYGISAHYNNYYNTFVVLTKIDIRVYDAVSGKLKKVFTDFNEERGNADLSSLTFGGKQRKFYLGDNSGSIRIFNMKTGEYLQDINQPQEEHELDKSKTIRKKENNEVSQMIFLHEEKLLITSAWDSTIRIYDESDPDDPMLLRIMSGGHKESDITCMDYSPFMNLLATGSANGVIVVWDFEIGKFESMGAGHRGDVSAVKFAEPFPILVSSSSEGTICVWAVKPCPLHQSGLNPCLLKIINSEWKLDGTEQRLGVNTLYIDTIAQAGMTRGEISGNFLEPREYETFIKGVLDPKPVETKLSKAQMKAHASDTSEKEKVIITEDTKAVMNLMDETLYTPFNKPPGHDFYESMDDFFKYKETTALEISQKKHRCYVYYGDQKGCLSILDLTYFLKKRDIVPLQPKKSDKKPDNFQLRRKEWIDASKNIDSVLSDLKNRKPIYSVHAFNTLMVRRINAHTQALTNISGMTEPRCMTTCSMDKHVKLWTMDGKQCGDLNLVKLGNTNWELPFDWVRHKLKDIENVFTVMKVIEKEDLERLSNQEKENIKLRYLISNYGNELEEMNFYGLREDSIPEEKTKREEKFYERGKDSLPSYLEPGSRFREKEYARPERREDESPDYNMSNYKEDDLRYKALKVFNDHDNKDKRDGVLGSTGKKKTKKNAFRVTSTKNIKSDNGSKSKKSIAGSLASGSLQRTTIEHNSGDEIRIEDEKAIEDIKNQTQRPLFSNFSAQQLKRNTSYATNLVKGYNKPIKKREFAEDMKYLPGESVRSLKLATKHQFEKFDSESQLVTNFVDKKALTQRADFYKRMRETNTFTNMKMDAPSTALSANKPQYKIVANRLFMDNPTKNDPKVLKSGDRLFVL